MSRPAILLALLPLCLGLIWGADRVLRPDAIAYEKTGQENEHPPGLFAETLLGDAVTHRLRAQRLKEQAEAATSLAEKALYFEQAAEALADAGAGEAAQARMLARAREAATAPPKRLELTARVAKLSASAEEAARLHRMLEDPGIGEDALPESSIRQAAEILGDTLPETGAFLRQALENPEPYLTESARRRRAAREAFTSPEEPISVTEQFEGMLDLTKKRIQCFRGRRILVTFQPLRFILRSEDCLQQPYQKLPSSPIEILPRHNDIPQISPP